MRNEESGLESSISLIESDLEYFHTDLSRIETLIRNNKEHLEKISSEREQAPCATLTEYFRRQARGELVIGQT